jgi:tetratricopeptide (TPR) repeat protein
MPRTVVRRAGDVVLGVLLLGLVGFAPLSRLVAEAQPVPPPPAAAERAVTADSDVPPARGADVRDLPAGPPESLEVTGPAGLRPLAEQALGAPGTDELLRILRDDSFDGELVETAVQDEPGSAAYPYLYPAMDRLLDSAPEGGRTAAGAALGAGLARLTLLPEPERPGNAAAAAYAVLDRARAGGDCAAQLNLLLLVAADAQPRDGVVEQEAARARVACPDDPTPGWLEGQYLSQRAGVDPHHAAGDSLPADISTRAAEVLADLVDDFPASAGAWSAYADDRLRFAQRVSDSQPFTARHAFEDALTAYRRADRLAGGTDTQPGQARALVGLGEPDRAVALLEPTVTGDRPGVRLQVLLQADEEARDFAAAEAVARRLDRLGLAAFVQGPPAFPVPGGATQTAEPVGTDRLAALTAVSLQPSPEAGGNGALVVDASFVPEFREESGMTGSEVDCPDWAWRRDAVLAGRAAEALEGWPQDVSLWFDGIRPRDSCPLRWPLEEVARAEAGSSLSLDAEETDDLEDRRQNLWRWAGDLTRAEEVVSGWAESAGQEDDPRPVQRLGEVRFLQERYDEAAALFGRAARLQRALEHDNDLVVMEMLVQRAASLLRTDRRAEATALLRDLDFEATEGTYYQQSLDNDESSARFAMVAYHARALLADSAQDAGELRSAAEDYAAARELVPLLREAGATGFRPERVDNNAAVALAGLGRGEDALAAARLAVAADPLSPVFLFTASVAAERAGDAGAAVDYAREALDSDPGAFPAANDLGVRLAREGRDTEAVAALRRAVGAAPDYALGWFNLGVVQSGRGPVHLPEAQGALARAFELDPDLADRERTPTADATTYQTELDLSRPLPPRWSFARLQQSAPAASAGLLAVVLLGVGLARSTGRGGGTDLAAQWLEPVTRRLERSALLRGMRRPWWAVAVTVLVLTVPALREPSLEVTTLVAGALGVLLMTVAAVRARALLARRRQLVAVQESWAPGMVFGLATAVVGSAWAPLPVVRTGVAAGRSAPGGQPQPAVAPGGQPQPAVAPGGQPQPAVAPGEQPQPAVAPGGQPQPAVAPREHPQPAVAPGEGAAAPAAPERSSATRVHAAAPLTLGVLSAVLFAEAAWFDVPITHSWAVAALVMTASTLLPVEPLDGARTGKAGLVGGLGVVGAALLVTLGLV